MKGKFALKTSSLFILSISVAYAIPPLGGFLPGSVKPEQVSKSLTTTPLTPVGPGKPIAGPAEQAPSPAGEAAKKIKFKLNGIILEGNHVYSEQQLKKLYAKLLHKTITIADLFGIVQAITNYYRNNGYIISRAILPPQHVKDGIVKIQIIEGYLDKVEVAGNPRGAKCLVKGIGKHIIAKRPLQLTHMERYMLIANEIPGTSVKAVLSPSKTTPAAANLTLVTNNNPYIGYLSYDNYGTRYIGPQQMTANVGMTSFINSGDMGQATFTKTPKGRELTFVDVNYNAALGDYGWRYTLGGTRALTNPLFVLRPLHIQGLNENYYFSFQYPWVRKRTESLTFQAAFNYLDSRVTALHTLLYIDHIRSIGLGLTYNFADKCQGANIIYVDVRQGLPIFGYTQNTNANTALTSRPGGYAFYTKFDLQVSRLQTIKGPWSAFFQVKAQYGVQPLLASEQFSFGGSVLGRGYDVAEILGDKGAAGSVELRYDWNVGELFMQTIQPYIYYDAGIVWNYLFIGGVPIKQSGTAYGLGARFYFTKYVSGNLMWTQVLTKPIAAEQIIHRGFRPRVFFSIVASL